MAKNYRPVVQETPQSSAAIRGRGASWSPANRFEKLHIDQNDFDAVDVDQGTEERPRRATQPCGDHHKEPSSYTRHRSFMRPLGAQRSGGERFRNFIGLELAASA